LKHRIRKEGRVMAGRRSSRGRRARVGGFISQQKIAENDLTGKKGSEKSAENMFGVIK